MIYTNIKSRQRDDRKIYKTLFFVLLFLTEELFATSTIDTNYFGSWYETYSGYYDRNFDPVTSDEAIKLDDTSIVMFRHFFDLKTGFRYNYSALSPNRILLIRPEDDTVIITFSRNKLVLKESTHRYVYQRLPKGYSLYSNPDDFDARKLLLKNYKTKFNKDTSLSFPIFLSNCLSEIFNQPVSIDSILKQQNYGAFIGIPDVILFKVIVSYYPKTILSPKCALFFSERKGKIYLLNQNDVFFKPSGVDSFALDNKINFTDSNVIQIANLFSSYIIDSLPGYVYPAPPKIDTSSVIYKCGKSLIRSICGEELIRSPEIISDSKLSILSFFAMNTNYLYYYHIRLYQSGYIEMNKFRLGRTPGPFM